MEVATPLIFLAPPCPDCGQPCRHPLTMAVDCPRCDGRSRDRSRSDHWNGTAWVKCLDCDGTGKVSPPPPTDEQIFGRECGLCHGKGKVGVWEPGSHNEEPDVLFGCGECGGTGRVGAAENRWTCPGGRQILSGDCPACGHDYARHYDYCVGDGGECGCSKGRPLCPGRTDVAPPEAWEAFVRQLRTRSKTTVLNGMHEDGLVLNRTFHLVDYAPEDALAKRGKWTVTVTFEPEAS